MAVPSSILGLFPSFVPGQRLVDAGELAQLVSQLFSVSTGLVAHAGGGQAAALPLPSAINQVGTVATAADSVMLPLAIPGAQCSINNATATSLQVFGNPANPQNGNVGDRIIPNSSSAPAATGTGVAQAGNADADYKCYTIGIWKQNLSA